MQNKPLIESPLLKSVLTIGFAVLILLMACHYVYRGVQMTPTGWGQIGKGALFALCACFLLFCRWFEKWSKTWTMEDQIRLFKLMGRMRYQQELKRLAAEHWTQAPEKLKKGHSEFFMDIIKLLPKEGEAWTAFGNVKMTQKEVEEAARRAEEEKQWNPENPKPQTIDWDDGSCPYQRDSSRPLGSRENPVVVGIPSASDHLVFSPDLHCWILTDGLGNGWIR